MATNAEEIKKRFERLPPAVRRVYLGEDTAEDLQEISKEHGLMIDQMGELADETGLVILGLTHPSKFIGNLASRLNIDARKAREIAEDVNEIIFHKIREELKKIHGISDSAESEMPESRIKNHELRQQSAPEPRPPAEKIAPPAPEIPTASEPKSEPPAKEAVLSEPTPPEPKEELLPPPAPAPMSLPSPEPEKELTPPQPKIEATPFEHKTEGEEIFRVPKEISEHAPPEPPTRTEPAEPAEQRKPKWELPNPETKYGGKDPYREPIE